MPTWGGMQIITTSKYRSLGKAILLGSVVTVLATAWLPRAVHASESFDAKSCTFGGKKLYGKIQVVKDFPDIKIQVVKNFPDVKVQVVDNFPDECGKWQMVDNFPDLKVQFVKDFPDVKIKYVDQFPGT